MSNKRGGRQALSKSLRVSDHCVRAQGDQFHHLSQDKLTHKIATNVDMTREFPAHLVFAHRNARKVILIDLCGLELREAEITQSLSQIQYLLASLTSGYKFSL